MTDPDAFQIRPSSSEKHRLLASVIPEIDCTPGCALCCEFRLGIIYDGGTNHLSPPGQFRFAITEYCELDTPGTCHQFVNGRCKIYTDRPLVCRLFWKIEGDPPCYGVRRPGKPFTTEQLRRFMWCWTWRGTIQDARAFVVWIKNRQEEIS